MDLNAISNNEALKDLTPEERNEVLKILLQMSQTGKSEAYDELVSSDWEEKPVDIETFITDDSFLGKAWKDAGGQLKIYPFWMEQLKKLFPTPYETNYNTVLETGARGIGKSEIACGAIAAYMMYRIMCMKNPLEYYHLKPTEKIVFGFMNLKKALAEEIASDKFQKTV